MEAFAPPSPRPATARRAPPPSGPGVFAAEAAAGIRRDVRLVSAASGLLLAASCSGASARCAAGAGGGAAAGRRPVAGYAAAVLFFGSCTPSRSASA
jgi:hypothetical protein